MIPFFTQSNFPLPPGYKPIKDHLVSILQGIVVNNISLLPTVSGREEKKLTSFPAACVTAKEHSSSFESLDANKRVYEHYIRLYFRTDEQNDPDYEDVLELVADQVIFTLEQNFKPIDGIWDWSIPISGVWGEGEKDMPLRVFEIVVASTLHVKRLIV
jgi:hypothetical protein